MKKLFFISIIALIFTLSHFFSYNYYNKTMEETIKLSDSLSKELFSEGWKRGANQVIKSYYYKDDYFKKGFDVKLGNEFLKKDSLDVIKQIFND